MPKGKIVRITFEKGWTMLFGNSYKPWDMQLEEYLLFESVRHRCSGWEEIEVCHSPWISFGGLKWCAEENFQKQLNREGCQADEPDNANPRQYKEMRFYRHRETTRKVDTLIKNIKKGIY